MTALSFGDIAGAFTDRKDPDRKRTPRRNSFDIDDQRAKVFQPVQPGSIGDYAWDDAEMRTVAAKIHQRYVPRRNTPQPQ